jgi:predicted thioesterase
MPPSPGQGVPAALLVEFMERAAAKTMRSQLSCGETSISLSLSLRQPAVIQSSPDTWHVTARRQSVLGRIHDFTVEVFDASGLIASGRHRRAVVIANRVVSVARRRLGQPAMLMQV